MKTIENRIVHIGSKIKYYRLLNKISLSKLASDANISKSTLFGLEEGRSNPTISTLVNIASTLGISLNELIGNNIDSTHNSNLTLISSPDNDNCKLYKLSLMPNEYFNLQGLDTSNMKIEVLDGIVSLIDNSSILHSGESTLVKYNNKFKAYSSGATLILKIYKLESTNYIKEDIFYSTSSKELVEEAINNSKNRLINRVIFTSISPISDIKTLKYLNYIEILSNKESHYYIFKRYQGLIGGVDSYLKHLNSIKSSKYKRVKEFINLSISNKSINKETFDLLDNNIIKDVKELVIDSTIAKKGDIATVKSIYDINSTLIENNNYILLLEELSNQSYNIKNISLTQWLYRVLESIYIIDESSLNNSELKMFNTIIQKLLKALYFSYNNYSNRAINILNSLVTEINKIKIINLESKFIKNYLFVSAEIESIIKRYNCNSTLNTTALVESISKDLNLSIEIKELIAPVIEDSGLYAYLFRVK